MKTLTIKQIIKVFLSEKLRGRKNIILGSHSFQTDITEFGLSKYNLLHTPETYVRVWRTFKKETKDYIIKESFDKQSKQKYYEISANEI